MAGYDGGSRFDEIYGKSPNLERMAYEAKRDAEYAVDAIKNFGAIASGKVGGAPAPSQLGVGDVLGGVSAGLKAFQDARKTSGTRMAGDALGSAFNIASSLPNYSSVFSSPSSFQIPAWGSTSFNFTPAAPIAFPDYSSSMPAFGR